MADIAGRSTDVAYHLDHLLGVRAGRAHPFTGFRDA